MGQLNLNSSGGGIITLAPANTATSGTITIPAGTGTISVQGLSSNIVSGTAQASTSGTIIDFTGIPSWVKRITIIFNAVSSNGSSLTQVQVGSGSIVTTGYVYAGGQIYGANLCAFVSSTSGFAFGGAGPGNSRYGTMTLNLINGNNWICSHSVGDSSGNGNTFGGGTINLGGVLDRVRITTVNGTDTFDAGSINILYE